MKRDKIDKHHLSLAGEFRVAAELLLRGLYASVTYGNMKGTDLHAIGNNRRAAVIEVKASQTNRFVTRFYQKYRTKDAATPDFWVLYLVKPPMSRIEDQFFVLAHDELAHIQCEVNFPGEQLSYEQVAARVERGVDNVSVNHVSSHKDAWHKIVTFCQE